MWMRLAALFSGGKDSSLAVQRALEIGHSVTRLVSITPGTNESYMFHFPNTGITVLQSQAAGIPIVRAKSKGVKEEEVRDMEDVLRSLSKNIEGVVVGALASSYQKERVERVCKRLGLEMVAPLWHQDPRRLWDEMLQKGFRIMMVGVACDGLGREWLGRVIDKESLDELDKLSRKHIFHLGGEGGEFESFTLDAPFFRKRIEVRKGRAQWDGDSGYFLIEEARLAGK